MRILVIEDDPSVQTLIKIVLEKKDYDVTLAETATHGQKLALDNAHDMIIMDLGLPDGNGYDICKLIREENLHIPILVLSADHETKVKVKCLEVGADDYLTKPFDTSELTARLNAINRRTNGQNRQKEVYSCGELKLDIFSRTLEVNDTAVDLTNNEFNLLLYLLKNRNRTVSQEDIAENVWDIHFDTQTNYINVYISYLRKKIREHSKNNYIETVRKKGFIIRCQEDK